MHYIIQKLSILEGIYPWILLSFYAVITTKFWKATTYVIYSCIEAGYVSFLSILLMYLQQEILSAIDQTK